MRRTRLLLALLLLSGAQPARADQGEAAARALANARRHWKELDYELVPADAQRVLAVPGASRAVRTEARWLEGAALVVLERPDQAVAAFRALFVLDPEYTAPPGSSPRILAVFEPARAAWQVERDEQLATRYGEALAALRADVRLPPRPRGGRPLDVAIQVADPRGIAGSLVLAYRRRGARDYSAISARARPGTNLLTIPGAVLASERAFQLELYVRVRHASGGTLRRMGDAARPLSLPVAAGLVPRPTPITRRWWFWAGAAAVVVAGGFAVDRMVPVGPQAASVVLP